MGMDAHVSLLLLTALLAMTVPGFPINRKIMPSPLWKNRPTTLLYPHRRLSRPWLVTMQDELWRDGPSGDGPEDEHARSSFISSKPRMSYVSEHEYRTQSPSLEDFSSSLDEPFPTIIDTMTDESSAFGEELISRTSMPYEGPSSLLNSFIFRPSLPPYLSPSSIKTPSLEESLEDSGSVYRSWLGPSSVLKMSSRQAVSDAISDHFVIITAIPATHINSDKEYTPEPETIPLRLPSGFLFSFQASSDGDSLETKTENLIYLSQPLNRETISEYRTFFKESQLHSSYVNILSDSYNFAKTFLSKELNLSFIPEIIPSSSDIFLNNVQTFSYRDNFSEKTNMPYISSRSFEDTLMKNMSPDVYLSSYPVDIRSDFNFEQSGSELFISSQIFNSFSVPFYTTIPFMSFKTSYVQTTVSLVSGDEESDKFTIPTSVIHALSSTSVQTSNLQAVDIFSSHKTDEIEFPHIASSFSDFNDVIPVISLWPSEVFSVANIISHEDIKTYIEKDYYTDGDSKLEHTLQLQYSGKFTPTTVYQIFSSTLSLFSDRQNLNKYSSSSTEPEYISENSVTNNDREISSIETLDQNHRLSSVNIEQNTPSTSNYEQNFIPFTREQDNTPSKENIFSLNILQTSPKLTVLGEASVNEINTLESSSIVGEYYDSLQKKTPAIASDFETKTANDSDDENRNLPQSRSSSTDLIYSPTHHITVRSLSSSTPIDISESMLQIISALNPSDSDNLTFPSEYILPPVINSSESSENATKLNGTTLLPEEMNTQDYFPTFLESSFKELEFTYYKSLNSYIFGFSESQQTFDLETSELTHYHSANDFLAETHTKEFASPLSSESQLYLDLITPLEKFSDKNELINSKLINTEVFSEGMITFDSADFHSKLIFPTKTLTPEIQPSSYYLQKITASQQSQNLSYIESVNKYDELIPTPVLSQQTLTENVESSSEDLESSFTLSNGVIKPSRYSEEYQIEKTISEYVSTSQPFILRSTITDSEILTFLEKSIELSETFSPSTVPKQSQESRTFPQISTEAYSMSKTPYLQTSLGDQFMIFSMKDYLSENLFLTSNSITGGDNFRTTEINLNDYSTPTVSWDISHISLLDHAGEKLDSTFELISSQDSKSNNSFGEDSKSDIDSFSTVFQSGTTLESIPFKIDSSPQSSLIYSQINMFSSEEQSSIRTEVLTRSEDQNYFYGSIPLPSPSFLKEFFTTPYFIHSLTDYLESKLYSEVLIQKSFDSSLLSAADDQFTFNPSTHEITAETPTISELTLIEDLKSKISQKYPEYNENLSFTHSSKDESVEIHHSLELSPSSLEITHRKSDWIYAAHTEADLKPLTYASKVSLGFDSDEKLTINEQTFELTSQFGISSITSSSLEKVLFPFGSDETINFGISVSPSGATPHKPYIPELTTSFRMTDHTESSMTYELKSDIFLSKVVPSHSVSLVTLNYTLADSFISKNTLEIYNVPGLTPSPSDTSSQESFWIEEKHPNYEPQTENDLSDSNSFIINTKILTPEESHVFYSSILSSSPPNWIQDQSMFTSTLPVEDPKSVMQSINIMSEFRQSDLQSKTTLASSTEYLPFTSESSVIYNESIVLNSTFFKPKYSEMLHSIELRKTKEPKSLESDHSVQKPEPKSLETDRTSSKTLESSVKILGPISINSSHPIKPLEPKSIESDFPVFSINHTKLPRLSSTLAFIQTHSDTSLTQSSVIISSILPTSTTTIKETQKLISTSIFNNGELTPVWEKESPTSSYDIEMASVLAISSFFGINGSRNASTGVENGGISENDEPKTDIKPTQSLDVMLFKDNNYWILTVLEAPIQGHLPENFSQILEMRLANAYSEAFKNRASKPESIPSDEKVVVKILSLTNDLLLSQVNIVYVVEKGGILVPASIASEFLNFLRHEQLREFLGLYAILKAKPYRPEESAESHPVSSSIPVVTIVCSILGFLLLLFCCFCVYCRCCRPKQADDPSPTPSTSGSLQRSLEKHGQHNRKHLFQEMAHQLTAEMVTQRKQESAAPDMYLPEKEPPPPGKTLPPLPTKEHKEALDKAIKMLKILENKDANTSPISGKRSKDKDRSSEESEHTTNAKKTLPKPKKRRKGKESHEKNSYQKPKENTADSELRPLPQCPKDEMDDKTSTPDENRVSPDSGTSSRHTSSSTLEKTSEEQGSDGSNTELLPPLKELIAKSKADSEAAAADTQIHLSRVRQRISELLDDAFALANGRKFYGSMRSKKINPATEMFPRYASLRSQSAAESSVSRHMEETERERRPISEGAQHVLGTVTDDGQLITMPPPKSVWDHSNLEESIADLGKYEEVAEAHNRHVNFFPFQQQQSRLRHISASPTSSALDTLQELHQVDLTTASTLSTINVLKEAASEVHLAHSSRVHPAVVDQYDEIDVVSALREGEPVADLIRAIKDELQKFSGTLPGTNNESNA